MSFLRNYFGTSKPAPAPKEEEKESKRPVRALPASWYTSEDMYELERRAIFSRKWLLTTHKHRVPNAGDMVRYTTAGYEYVIMKDQDENISGYESNSLKPIHVHLDCNGFIWINLDAGEKPEISWEDDFEGVDSQPRYQFYNFEEYSFDHTWDMEGDFNWKILADNYNECYHCQVAHPDIPTIADLNSYYVKTKDNQILHYGAQRQDQIEKGFRIATTYFWPNASCNVSPHFFFMQRFTPISPGKCVMRYEVYRNKNSNDEQFTTISDMYKRIMTEDKYLCTHSQKNLNAGIFVNGELHPEMEKGPIHFQSTVRDIVTAHHKKEIAAGHQISPAHRGPVSQDNTTVSAGFDAGGAELSDLKMNVAQVQVTELQV